MAKKAKVKVELNYKGFNELRKSPEMQSVLAEHGQRILGTLPEGYEGNVRAHQKRAVFYIYADSPEAKADNLKNNTLLKAIGGG